VPQRLSLGLIVLAVGLGPAGCTSEDVIYGEPYPTDAPEASSEGLDVGPPPVQGPCEAGPCDATFGNPENAPTETGDALFDAGDASGPG